MLMVIMVSLLVFLSKKNKNKKSSDLEAFCETTDLKTGDKTFSYNVRKRRNSGVWKQR